MAAPMAVVVEGAGVGGPSGVPLPLPPYKARAVGFGALLGARAEAALSEADCSEEELLANLRFVGHHWHLAGADALPCGAAVARLLRHGSPEVAAAAAEALGHHAPGAARHAEDLVALLSSSLTPPLVRSACAFALGALGAEGRRHARALADAVGAAAGGDDAAVQLRVSALEALGRLGASDCAAVAAEALDRDPSARVQSAACLALAGMAEESRAKDIAARLGREGTRLAAVAALGALGPTAGGHTGEMVAMALASRDARERSEALAALAKCGGGDLSQQLLPLLRDSAPGVRAAAAMALGRLGAVAAADDIAALLEDVAEDSGGLPHEVGGAAPREPMALRKPRCAALVALGAIGAGAHAPGILELLAAPDWEVRFCALEALAALGPDVARGAAARRVAERLDDEAYTVRAKACATLGALGAEDEAERLAELLRDRAQAVRAEAALALAQLGEPGREFVAEVAKLTEDVSNNVRSAAARALADFGGAARPYAIFLARLVEDPLPDVRAEACAALAALGAYGTAFAEEVATLLEDPSAAVRAAAERALGVLEAGSPRLPEHGASLEGPAALAAPHAAHAALDFEVQE